MRRDVVVIGGSAGALDPLRRIATDLPPDLPASVLVCLHLAATAKSALVAILNRAGGIHVAKPRDGDPLRPGYMYVPTPDHHLALENRSIRLTRTPRVNGARPAVDVLFRSAAAVCGPRVIGVLLSGGLDDGSAGLAAIRAAGGMTIAQAPDDAAVDSMPKSAIELGVPEFVLTAAEIGPAIARGVGHPVEKAQVVAVKREADMEAVGARDTEGQVTGITCPDCHGSIRLHVAEGGQIAFTCGIGHRYSPESFFEIQSENVENALWAGVRSLEEQAAVADAMAARATRRDDAEAAKRYERRREIAGANAGVLRKLLLERPGDAA